MKIDQNWFEMPENLRKNLDKSVWIPLRASKYFIKEGKYGYKGFKEDYIGVGSIVIPSEAVDKVKKHYGWSSLGLSSEQKGGFLNDHYYQADEKLFEFEDGQETKGIHLVLTQQIMEADKPEIWHLNQDLVLTLDLVYENDKWLSAKDGYIEVVRLQKDVKGSPILLEIKAEYLKDYLCARNMALYVSSYFKRNYIAERNDLVSWGKEKITKKTSTGHWNGHKISIHEGGEHYGSSTAVFHTYRTDAFEDEDVPNISSIPTDENIKSEQFSYKHTGIKLYRYLGEYWSDQIVYPARFSKRIKEDKAPSSTFFITDVDGLKQNSDELTTGGKWLWFNAEVINALSYRRGGNLKFYTENTGSVSCCHDYGYDIHFGINEIGLIIVYAKDIAYLPEWQRVIWQGFNVTPEGGISKELHASQVLAQPADTKAPESYLLMGYNQINEKMLTYLGVKVFREHSELAEIFKRIHRFRAIDQVGFFSLAKDLARVIVDSIDTNVLQNIVPPNKGQKLGSLKSLEKFLAKKYKREDVRRITAPLVGIYELRHADAHLASSKIDEAFKLVEIDQDQIPVFQALQMLKQVTTSLWTIAQMITTWNDQSDQF